MSFTLAMVLMVYAAGWRLAALLLINQQTGIDQIFRCAILVRFPSNSLYLIEQSDFNNNYNISKYYICS